MYRERHFLIQTNGTLNLKKTYLANQIHIQPHCSSISLHVYAKMYVQSIYSSTACDREYISKG